MDLALLMRDALAAERVGHRAVDPGHEQRVVGVEVDVEVAQVEHAWQVGAVGRIDAGRRPSSRERFSPAGHTSQPSKKVRPPCGAAQRYWRSPEPN
jgi:hypothetical protein